MLYSTVDIMKYYTVAIVKYYTVAIVKYYTVTIVNSTSLSPPSEWASSLTGRHSLVPWRAYGWEMGVCTED